MANTPPVGLRAQLRPDPRPDAARFPRLDVQLDVAVGIARRTFFRYFPSKNDVVWGSFGQLLDRFEGDLGARPDDLPTMEAIRRSTLEFNTVQPAEQPWHRTRLALILETPALQAYSTGHYRAWRDVVARFAGRRLGVDAGSLTAQAIGSASLGVSIAAYEAWLAQPGSDLLSLLDEAFDDLSRGFAG